MQSVMQKNPVSAKSTASPPVEAGDDFRVRQEREVEVNYEAFKAQFGDLYSTHAGEYALMRDGKVVEFFQEFNDAMKTGRLLYSDRVFSVQKVSHEKVDLGYWNHALLHARR